MASVIPRYFTYKKEVIQLDTYITYFTVTMKTYLSIHQKGDRFVVSLQTYYTVIILVLEKDFPEDSIYSRSRDFHLTRVYVLTGKRIAFRSWAMADVPWKTLKGHDVSSAHLLRIDKWLRFLSAQNHYLDVPEGLFLLWKSVTNTAKHLLCASFVTGKIGVDTLSEAVCKKTCLSFWYRISHHDKPPLWLCNRRALELLGRMVVI